MKLDISNIDSGEYEIETICNSVVYKKMNKKSIKAILSGFFKRLLKKRKYLRICISHSAS